MRRLGGDIQRVADGGEASPALQRLVEEMKMIPLDESAGEGYHRETNAEKVRAPASETQHLKAKARHKQELQRIRRWTRKYGPRGKAVVRYEWRHWRRVIQSRWKRRWSNPHLSSKAVFGRIYRTDTVADQNWSSIVERQGDPRPVVTEDGTERSRLNDEYLNTVLLKNRYYSLPKRTHTIDEDGVEKAEETTEYFQVLQKSGSHTRPHLMPTFESADDVSLTATLAVEVQPCSVHSALEPEAADEMVAECVLVYCDGEPEWVKASSLGAVEVLSHQLQTYNKVLPSTQHEGCMVLSDMIRAKPHFDLLDDACPTLCIVHWLNQQKWTQRQGTVTHSLANDAVLQCDGRQSVRMKPYYQVLTVLSRCVPLTSSIPSTQCKLFYKCLLKGFRVEPGMGDGHYRDLLNADATRKGKRLIPIEPPEPPARRALLDDDDIVVAGPAPKAKPRAKPKGRDRGPAPLRPPLRAGPSVPEPPPIEGPPVPPVSVDDPVPPVPKAKSGPPTPPVIDPAPHEPIEDSPVRIEDDSIVVATEEVVTPVYAPRTRHNWQPGLGDALIAYDLYEPVCAPAYPNWIMHCPRHKDCSKSRKVSAAHTGRHGAVEPPAFLHAWLETDHSLPWRQAVPTDEAVDAIVEAQRAGLEDIVRRAGL